MHDGYSVTTTVVMPQSARGGKVLPYTGNMYVRMRRTVRCCQGVLA